MYITTVKHDDIEATIIVDVSSYGHPGSKSGHISNWIEPEDIDYEIKSVEIHDIELSHRVLTNSDDEKIRELFHDKIIYTILTSYCDDYDYDP